MEISEQITGHMHPLYAGSLREFGHPRKLPHSGAWILERPIHKSPYRDAMGCYPLLACENWQDLETDLAGLEDELVSLAVVTDPFGNYTVPHLRRCFNHVVRPFKEHFIVDLSRPLESYVQEHHRRNARKALQNIEAERRAHPVEFLDV